MPFPSLSDFFYDRGWDFAGDVLGNLSDWFGGMIDQYGVFGAIGLLFVEEAGIPILLPGDVLIMNAYRSLGGGNGTATFRRAATVVASGHPR